MERQRRRRRRPALSCIECRRRKIKCDRNDPCNHCTSTQTQCTFRLFNDGRASSAEVRPRSPSSASQSTRRAPGSNDAPAEVHTNSTATQLGSNARSLTVNAARTVESQAPDRSHREGSSWQDLSRRVQRLEESSGPAASPRHLETAQNILANLFGTVKPQILMNKTRTLRSSHWMGMCPEFRIINGCYLAISEHGSSQNEEVKAWCQEIGTLLQNCKVITKTLKIGKPTRTLPSLEAELAPPLGDAADDMVRHYMECFESTIRVVHAGTFWDEYRQYKEDPNGAKMDLRLKVLLVVGLGSAVGPPDHNFRNTVQHWIYAAQRWLTGPLEKDRLSISGIQIQCLTILSRQVFTVGADLVWLSTGHLIHTAMQMGLHRDPQHLPPMSVLQAETRRRLWATVLEMALQSSLDAAMPPRISLDEFDTQPPASIDDEDLTESTTSITPQDADVCSSTAVQLALLDSFPTRLEILRRLTSLHSEVTHEEAIKLGSEMSRSLRGCGAILSKRTGGSATAFHRNMIDYHLRRFMIPLHCAFACIARTNPLYQSSLKICLDTALSLLSPQTDEGFSHILAMSGGMFREGLRSACCVLGLEIIAETTAQRDEGALHGNSAYLKMLKASMKYFIKLSAERIRQGENNVKLYMFLNMIMAQVGAMEAGTDLEASIAKTGRDSLRYCYEILQERASQMQQANESRDVVPDMENWQLGPDFEVNRWLFMPSPVFF